MSCLTPIHVKPKPEKPPVGGFSLHSVPCGKCHQCRLRRIQGWVFRLQQESKLHKSAYFVTLTYDIAPRSPSGLLTLSRGYYYQGLRKDYVDSDGDIVYRVCKRYVSSDLQKFIKRLRKNTGYDSIKYYAVGEYGGETFRPHYHLIIFDVEPEDVICAWTENNIPIGHVHFGQVTNDSIAYCAKYIAKDKKIPMWDGDDRVKEYSVMSKGLGANYLTPAVVRYHSLGLRSYLTMPGGATHAMPRYYRERIFSEDDKNRMNESIMAVQDEKLYLALRDYGFDYHKGYAHEDNKAVLSKYYSDLHYRILASNEAHSKNNKRNKI